MKRICAILLVGFGLIVGETATEAQTILFGPKEYAREEGKPKEIKDRFLLCSPGSAYTLVVQFGPGAVKPDKEKGKHGWKGEEHEARVASAEIELNGKKVVSPHEFKRKGEAIRKAVSLKEDNTLEVELHGEPGGAVTVWIECEDCITLSIDEPTAGTTLSQPQALVRGRLTTKAPEIGVTANGILGQVNADAYAVLVPLQAGENLLSIRATDACGAYASQTVAVYGSPGASPVRLQALPFSGLAPLEVKFEASAGFAPTAIQWDFEGDGTVDQRGPNLAKVTFAYPSPGIYFPTVTVTGGQGQSAATTAIVSVQSEDQMDALLKGKWEGIKQVLSEKDVGKALRFFSERSRDGFKEIFMALRERLPEIVKDWGDIALMHVRDNGAKYRLTRAEQYGGQVLNMGYHLYFIVDGDGIWRLERF